MLIAFSQLPPTPPPAPPPALPLARLPFDPAWQVHNLGHFNIHCPDCGALHWMDERLTSSSLIRPKFGMCCYQGKIILPPTQPPPIELYRLLMSRRPARSRYPRLTHKRRASYGHAQGLSDWRLVI